MGTAMTSPDDFAQRVAVVTGASSGIGAAVVRAFAARGVSVAYCARDDAALRRLDDELSELPGTIRSYRADMSQRDAVLEFLDRAEADLGAADILINNVGQSPSRNFLYMTDDDWLESFELNLMSAVRSTRRLLPAMRSKGWGRVVMISSGAARSPNAATIDYAAAKAAMVSVAKSLARKYGPDNVLVNSVLPGLIRTPMWERAAGELAASSGGGPEAVFVEKSGSVPLRRFGDPAEVADLVLYLCSDRASYLTGAAIDLDGGLSAHAF